MHESADLSGKYFAECYSLSNQTVVDVGGLDVNGSLRKYFTSCNFICVDIEPHESVDIVIKPGDSLPFEDSSIDIIVSSSCFEHDPCFWITFKEMCRILKIGGYIYINAPSSGPYHGHPGDNWRFYADAGQSLAYWSGICNYPVNLQESFIIDTYGRDGFDRRDGFAGWDDFVCVFKRSKIKETEIVKKVLNEFGGFKLKNKLLTHGLSIKEKNKPLSNSIVVIDKEINSVYFGSDYIKLDVTSLLSSLTGFIEIPAEDDDRLKLFGDPLVGILKSIFIKYQDGTVLKYPRNKIKIIQSTFIKQATIEDDINYYYINLDKAHDRNMHFLNQYNSARLPFNKLTRFAGLEGDIYNFTKEEIQMFENCDYHNLRYKKNIMGNQLSHYYILQDIIKNKYHISVVFQDDSVLKNDFQNHLNNIVTTLPDDVEMLNIGFHKYASDAYFIPWDLSSTDDSFQGKLKINDYISKLKNEIKPCSLAYLITLKGAINMVEYFNKTTFIRATDGNFNDYLQYKDIHYGSNLVLVTGNSTFKSDVCKY